jgi:8-oxo-dGTP pyrophosphatase MutT (NUDIX family)
MKKWRLAETREVGHFRVFAVDNSDLYDSEGRRRGDVYTMRCSNWCHVIPITPEGQVVMVWQYRFGSDELSLEIPGGVIDEGEEPIVCAARELLEETGYAAGALEPFGVVQPNPALSGNRLHSFIARDVTFARATAFDPLEELEVALVNVADIASLLDSGVIQHALVHGTLERFLRLEAVKRPSSTASLVEGMEALQREKVVALARRLKPGLTAEDIRNPHDFPELNDSDWHYEDGVLTGLQSVLMALRSRERENLR